MTCFISCLNQKGKLEHFKVPRPVFNYVKQLETYIKHPRHSDLLNVYEFRFGDVRLLCPSCGHRINWDYSPES